MRRIRFRAVRVGLILGSKILMLGALAAVTLADTADGHTHLSSGTSRSALRASETLPKALLIALAILALVLVAVKALRG
jgi:hypothetical protein